MLANGKEEDRYGPFQSYKEAQALWQQMSSKIYPRDRLTDADDEFS